MDLQFLELLRDELDCRDDPQSQILAGQCEWWFVEIYRSKTPAPKAAASEPKRKSSLDPTAEQLTAIDLFRSGKDLRINAFAGAGKTSTLVMLAERTHKRGQYLAFNTDIVADAKKKMPDVDCLTINQMAYRATPASYKVRQGKMTGLPNAFRISKEMSLPRLDYGGAVSVSETTFATVLLNAISKFCQSGDAEILPCHVTLHGRMASYPRAVAEEIRSLSLAASKKLWARMCDPGDLLDLGHDGYVKLWALSNPKIPAEFILLDEAQDTNSVILEVLGKQDTQVIYVGDKYQQIYEWRGAVNAMERIETANTASLTTSFRFGDAIADYATNILELLGEDGMIRGNPGVCSFIGRVSPEVILARTNANAIAATIDALYNGKRPHLVGDKKDLRNMLRGVADLKAGRESTAPELAGFKSWGHLADFARGDDGKHLLTFVNLVENRGEAHLLSLLGKTDSKRNSDISISTAHKAKGREWETVRLMDDFLPCRLDRDDPSAIVRNGRVFDEAELRLFYVAVTRGKIAVEIPSSLLHQIAI